MSVDLRPQVELMEVQTQTDGGDGGKKGGWNPFLICLLVVGLALLAVFSSTGGTDQVADEVAPVMASVTTAEVEAILANFTDGSVECIECQKAQAEANAKVYSVADLQAYSEAVKKAEEQSMASTRPERSEGLDPAPARSESSLPAKAEAPQPASQTWAPATGSQPIGVYAPTGGSTSWWT